MRFDQPPSNITALRSRLEKLTGSAQSGNLVKRTVACVVVGQMLPPSVVKGGAAMRVRLGTGTTRFSQDLDVSRNNDDLHQFLDELREQLRIGWAGFTGRVVDSRQVSRPVGVPNSYIMRAFNIKLDYNGRPWMTLPLEVGHDEIGDTDRAESGLATDVIGLFNDLGLPQPEPIALLSIEDQVAQKLHACTAPHSDRAHDLVDLQLLSAAPAGINLEQARTLCERLFQSRRLHTWPPIVTAGESWPELYAAAVEDIDADEGLLDFAGAITWCNELIAAIDTAVS